MKFISTNCQKIINIHPLISSYNTFQTKINQIPLSKQTINIIKNQYLYILNYNKNINITQVLPFTAALQQVF